MWILYILLPLAAVGLIAYFIYENNTLYTRRIHITSEKLKNARIVVISDLHNKSFGTDNQKLVSIIKAKRPDVVLFAGDLTDRRKPYKSTGTDLLKQIAGFSSVYMILGNHDLKFGHKERIRDELIGSGVFVLENMRQDFTIGGQEVSLLGLCEHNYDLSRTLSREELDSLIGDFSAAVGYKILICHQPQFFSKPDYEYSSYNLDLVVAGHTHGGVVQFPFIGALLAPGQGFFPKYSKGLYEENETKMIVSSGLGPSVLPIRFRNKPEIIVLDFQ